MAVFFHWTQLLERRVWCSIPGPELFAEGPGLKELGALRLPRKMRKTGVYRLVKATQWSRSCIYKSLELFSELREFFPKRLQIALELLYFGFEFFYPFVLCSAACRSLASHT